MSKKGYWTCSRCGKQIPMGQLHRCAHTTKMTTEPQDGPGNPRQK